MIEPRPARELLSGKELARIRAMAIRRGNWYRILNKTERALLNLTIRIVEEVRSRVLNRVLVSIIAKLQVKSKRGLAGSLHGLGLPIAEKISKIAQTWGNESAAKWSADSAFIRFLEVLCLNTHYKYTSFSEPLLKRG